MPIKAKYNGSYKDITDLMNVDESIDYVLAKTSSSYKRVYTATRSIEGPPPTTFKSIKPGANLTDYRIYGNTSKNILPLSKTPKTETIGDILCEYDGKGTFTFTSNVDNPTYTQDQWFWVPFEEDFDFPVGISDGGHGCIQLNNDFATGYGVTPYFVGFANRNNGEFVSGFNVAGTALNIVDTNYYTEDLEGLPANCIAFQYLQQIGKRTVTIKPALYLDIRTQQPFEPYDESVGDRTGNLFDINSPNVQKKCYYDATGQKQNSTYHDISDFIPCGANNSYTLSFRVANDYFMNYGIFVNLWDNQKNFVSNLAAEVVIYPTDINKTMQYNITPLQDGYITFNYLYDMGYMTNIMLVEGSTPLPYEPYGYKVPMTVEGKNLFDYDTITHGYRIQWSTGANYADETAIMSDFISVSENSTYATDTNLYWICYDTNKQYIGAWNGSDIIKSGVDAINSMTAISPCKFIRILSFGSKTTPISSATMLNCGSTALPYEPYHAPITTPIYLPEPIKMVGDEAEYIDYGEQKQHRVRKNLFNETLYNKNVGNNTLIYIPIYVGNVNYVTCSTTCPKTISGNNDNFNSRYIFILSGNVNTGAVNDANGVSNGAPRTIQPSNGYVTIAYRKNEGYGVRPWEYQTMLNVGSTPLPYEPYIENTEVDVTLPALPTLPGTNVLSVGTEVQPSKIDITGHIKTISGGS